MVTPDDFAQVTTIPAPGPADFAHTRPSLYDGIHDKDAASLFQVFDHSQIGLAMIDAAASQLWVGQGVDGSVVPQDRYVHPFWPAADPQPWSAFFLSWCYKQAVNRTPPWSNPGLVDSIHAWARATNSVVHTPMRGDIFGVGSTHVGLVTRSMTDTILTLEGNTVTGCVRPNERSHSGLWFARI